MSGGSKGFLGCQVGLRVSWVSGFLGLRVSWMSGGSKGFLDVRWV